MSGSPSSSDRWQATWRLFHELLEHPEAERGAWLHAACRGDEALRREVEELVAAHEAGHPVLDLASQDPSRDDQETIELRTTMRPGMLIAGRFAIRAQLGVGGMGEVYEAEDRELGRRVALKTLLAGRARAPAALARFRKEIQLAQQVTHRNVCRVYDLVRDGDLTFLTMELLEGETLAARIARERRLGLVEAKAILEQMVAALEAAHEMGIVHRDLKPSNVVLVEESTGLRVVVTDFGLATSGSRDSAGDPQLTRTGEVLGTPAYMAPEQLEAKATSTATDVYALGLVLYEMVTGKRPFTGGSALSLAGRRLVADTPSPRTHLPELDQGWEQVILRCLQRDPADRFQHPREVVEALQDPSFALRSRQRGRGLGRRTWTVLAAAGLVLLGAWLMWWPRSIARSGDVRPPAGETSEVPASGATFEAQDAVIVAAFENRTGDPSFDGVLAPAFARELSSSTFVTVASRSRIADALQLMRLAPDHPVTAAVARDVALRDGAIRAVVTGTLDRVGASLVVNAQLRATADDSLLSSWSETADDGTPGLQAAVRRISLGIRQALGENPRRVLASGEQLERVTTPSLRALRLYDEADPLINTAQFATAQELLSEAIREDPDFASAHLLLAYALFNDERPREELMPHVERALELADEVPDRERYFIRASYFGFMGDRDRASASYQALLQLYPDHYWANMNLAGEREMQGDMQGATPYLLRLAKLRPNDFLSNRHAATALALVEDRLGEAQPYVDRMVALAAQLELPVWHEEFAAWARLWGAHRAWARADLDTALAELDGWAAEDRWLADYRGIWLRTYLIRGYRTLGMAARAMQLAPMPDFRRTRSFYRGIDAYFDGDAAGVLAGFTGENWGEQEWLRGLWMDPVRVAALARSGWLEEADRAAREFRERPPFHASVRQPATVEARMAGELTLAAGNAEGAAKRLEEGAFGAWDDNQFRAFSEWYGGSYFLAAQTLAMAYRQLGRDQDAVSILERAVAEKDRCYPNGCELWLDTQLRLARLHRELGHDEVARKLEEELRRLMRYADPDFWLVEQLARSEGG